MRRIFAAAASCLLALGVSAASTESFSWYYKPRTDGIPPEVIPEARAFLDEHHVIYADHSGEKNIYLTFDAGYENGNVEKILDVLKEKEAPGTFFILPQIAREHRDLLRRMKEEGHIVGNHSTTHHDMSKITDFDAFRTEIEGVENAMTEYTGLTMDKFFRPPEGRFSEQSLAFADELGYTTVFWDLAYADWDNDKQMAPAEALKLVLSRTHPGAVVLLHPTSATNAAILGDYIDAIRADGFTIRPLTDIGAGQEAAK